MKCSKYIIICRNFLHPSRKGRHDLTLRFTQTTCNGTHPTPSSGDKPPECGRAVRKDSGTNSKNDLVKLDHLHIHQGSPLYPIFRNPQPSHLYCQRSPSHHPSNLPSIYPVLALHMFRPSTSIRYSRSSIHPRVRTVSILADLLYSRELPFFFSSPTHIFILNSIHRDTTTEIIKHFISSTFNSYS